MPIDIKVLRAEEGGDPEMVRRSQAARKPGKKEAFEAKGEDWKQQECVQKSVGLVDEVIALDKEWRKLQFTLEELKADVGKLQKEIGKKKKAKENADDLIEKALKMREEIKALEPSVEDKAKERNTRLGLIGNFVHDSVTVSVDEELNPVVAKHAWEARRMLPERFAQGVEAGEEGMPSAPAGALLPHHQLLHMIGGFEGGQSPTGGPSAGVKVAGERGYFMSGAGVALNQALLNFGHQFLAQREYTALQPPFFMNKDVMSGVAQLEQFDEELYHVGGSGTEGQEKYLIATSEQPICAFHKDETLTERDLPKRYAGLSTCFRKEAGSHGRDTWGIFRVHQFEKVEQFVITEPDESWKAHEEMVNTAQEFYKLLGIPYRVVNIVSGELNNAAAKKLDLEGWFPFQGNFRELVSASNCTDYQSRSMNIRFGHKKLGDREKKFVHMLNATLAATGRVISSLLENNQTETGVRVPPCLVPYMGIYGDFLPFVRDAKPNVNQRKMEALKKKGKKGKKGAAAEDQAADGKPKSAKEALAASGKEVPEGYALAEEAWIENGVLAFVKKEHKLGGGAAAGAAAGAGEQSSAAAGAASAEQGAGALPKLHTSAGLGHLNGLLASRTYACGHRPSSEDAALFAALKESGAALGGAPNVARWFAHVETFAAHERLAWPSGGEAYDEAAASRVAAHANGGRPQSALFDLE